MRVTQRRRRGDTQTVAPVFAGFIDAGELGRVIKALDPDFAEKDIKKLMQSIDRTVE